MALEQLLLIVPALYNIMTFFDAILEGVYIYIVTNRELKVVVVSILYVIIEQSAGFSTVYDLPGHE